MRYATLMSANAAESRVWTAAEYLAWERASPEKHGFYRGEVFAMAGASRAHHLIVANILRLLGTALLDRPCESYPSDMRVRVLATGLYTYPDVTALCQPPVFEDEGADTLTNPELIVEVLSTTTEAYDRGEKFEHYRSIPSFREYVLVAQDKPLVEHFVRQADGTWNLRVLHAGDTLASPGLSCAVEVNELYRKVFEPEAQTAS
jgi:Uma2 family endonuclease